MSDHDGRSGRHGRAAAGPAGRPDLRGRIAALLEQVRAGLPGTVPLTSLEEQMAGGASGPHASAHR